MAHATVHAFGTTSPARRAWIRIASAWILLPLFFLAVGRSLHWWEAWAYCAIVLIPMTWFASGLARRDPDFLERRLKLAEKEPAQRRVLLWAYPFLVAAFVIPGLDHQFGWSDLPVPMVVVALAVCLAAYLVILRVLRENRWAGRTIETSPDQRVISTGPYAIVRHPMYAASLVLYLASPVALGSGWGVLPALVLLPIFAVRIRHEEELLMRELAGYPAYRERVRHRLIPWVW